MIQRTRAILAIAAVAAFVLSAAASAGEKVNIRLNFYAAGLHAPFYVSLEKGYFTDEGIDATVEEGTGSGTTVKLIANQSDFVGFTDAGTACIGITQEMPVKIVSPIYQINGFSIITLADSGINSPKDLEGKMVGITEGDAPSKLFDAVASSNSVDKDKIDFVAMDSAAKSNALMHKQVAAILGGADDQAIKIANQGFEVKVLRYADWGVPTIGLAMIAHDNDIANKKDLLQRTLRAILRGWEYAYRNPDDAIAIEQKYITSLDAKVGRQQLDVALSCLFAADSDIFGKATDAHWEKTIELLRKYSGLDPKLPASAFYDNSCLPGDLPRK